MVEECRQVSHGQPSGGVAGGCGWWVWVVVVGVGVGGSGRWWVLVVAGGCGWWAWGVDVGGGWVDVDVGVGCG